MSNRSDEKSVKILVLGDSGVGKSSLVHLICHNEVLSSTQCTIGCCIDVKLQGDCVLELWEIGGSRSHKIARPFFYSDYHGIILVFDATNKKSRTNLEEWLQEVMEKSSHKDLETFKSVNNIITIGTKRDQLSYNALKEYSNSYHDENYRRAYNSNHSSVVNIGDTNAGSMLSHRTNSLRNLGQGYLSSYYQSSGSSSTSNFSESAALVDSVILCVNTQDKVSFEEGSQNSEILNSFFKETINRKIRNFYNKMTI